MSLEIIGMIGAAPEKNVSSKSQVSVIGSGIDGDPVINFAKANMTTNFADSDGWNENGPIGIHLLAPPIFGVNRTRNNNIIYKIYKWYAYS